jgi:predicted CXXCH cytochrome family protein
LRLAAISSNDVRDHWVEGIVAAQRNVAPESRAIRTQSGRVAEQSSIEYKETSRHSAIGSKRLIFNVDHLSPGVADDGLFHQKRAVLIPGKGMGPRNSLSIFGLPSATRCVTASLLLILATACHAAEDNYLGRAICAGCHKTIAAVQARTRMARTWQGVGTKLVPSNYSASESGYSVNRTANTFEFAAPGLPAYPVETTIGGDRHGLSFLVRVREIDGLPLERPALVEARYLHSTARGGLALSPGFPENIPTTLETALGRVLPPQFEKKCLTCHGAQSGVNCENCHGPGKAHLTALVRKSVDKGLQDPRKACAQCHAGFSLVKDPLPEDLLISEQVTALENTECWRQSSGKISCVDCHDPHRDMPRAALVAKSEKTCLGCHSATRVDHAGLCPVNRSNGCVDCHMPEEQRGPFAITDHWIRANKHAEVSKRLDEWRSKVLPKHLLLRMIVTADRAKAENVRQQLENGASSFNLARSNSVDDTAISGGFLGDLDTSHLDPVWAAKALALDPGELSEVIEGQAKYFILQRLPRDFREQANTHFRKAMDLRKTGDRTGAATELLEALKIYPYFLRALTYLGITYGEAGNPQAGAGVLRLATTLHPHDAGAHFNLGIAYGAQGDEREISEYQRAIELDPDLAPAYLNWGAALFAKQRPDEAIQVYRRGIEVNPMIAGLHYSLSVALSQTGQTQAAEREMAFARKIDPKLEGH